MTVGKGYQRFRSRIHSSARWLFTPWAVSAWRRSSITSRAATKVLTRRKPYVHKTASYGEVAAGSHSLTLAPFGNIYDLGQQPDGTCILLVFAYHRLIHPKGRREHGLCVGRYSHIGDLAIIHFIVRPCIFSVTPMILNKLLIVLNECSEWGRVAILSALAWYEAQDEMEISARDASVVLGAVSNSSEQGGKADVMVHLAKENNVNAICLRSLRLIRETKHKGHWSSCGDDKGLALSGVNVLMDLIATRVSYVVQEAVVVMKKLDASQGLDQRVLDTAMKDRDSPDVRDLAYIYWRLYQRSGSSEVSENLLDFDDQPAPEQATELAATHVLQQPAAMDVLSGTSTNPLDELVSIFGNTTMSPNAIISSRSCMVDPFGRLGGISSPTVAPDVSSQQDLLGLF
ncbi:hypothetical protein BGW80DRAFT_1443776 [Lactifluus volemus]|nr:hypothetical protein BGW80DRAFT_1443776 [Lactifluus volemus]